MFSNFKSRLEVDMESLLTRDEQQQQQESGNSSPSSSYFNYFQSTLSPPPPAIEEDDYGCCATVSEYCSFSSLTLQQRIGGCLGCMTLGYILSFGSFFRLSDLLSGNSTTFVLYFTIGNILSLAGSCFLSGPTSQLQKMWHTSRRLATILYLSSLVLTLGLSIICSHEEWKRTIFGFGGSGSESGSGSGDGSNEESGDDGDAGSDSGDSSGTFACIALLLTLMIMQYVSVAWYCLSYIPFARQLAKRLWGRLCATVLDFDS